MEPLRPGERLQPLLLIPRRSGERSSSGAGRLGRVFFDSWRSRPSYPDEFGSGSRGPLKHRVPLRAWAPIFTLSAASSERICPGFAFNSRQTDWRKKPEFQWWPGQMCDGPHIYRRAAGLGFNPRKVLWGDFARVSAAQTPFRHERSKPKAYKPCRAPLISDRSILSRTDPCDRDFVTRFHRRWPGQLWWLLAASSRRSTSALL